MTAVAALRSAFDALIGAAGDDTRERVLRCAIRQLAEEPRRPSHPNGADQAPARRRRAAAAGRRRGRPPTRFKEPAEPNGALTSSERERLAFLASSGVSHAGIPQSVLQAALDGVTLEADEMGRVKAFLAG
jgi:hypothetical protein